MRLCLQCGEKFYHDGWKCPSCHYEPKFIGDHWCFAPFAEQESNEYDTLYFAQLIQFEDGNFWFRSRNKLIIWAIDKFFQEAKSLLEIGCGTGYVLSGIEKAYPNLSLSGSDIFSHGLSYASQRMTRCELFQMDAHRIPFAEEFDIVSAFDVLEHIEDDEVVLKQMEQACCPGGGIILTIPQHRILWSKADGFARHKRRYSREEIINKVRSAGFSILKVTSFVTLLLPILIVSRLRDKFTKTYDPWSEFKLSPFLNNFMGKILRFERDLIRIGLLFPVGGSLLLVAKKK